MRGAEGRFILIKQMLKRLPTFFLLLACLLPGTGLFAAGMGVRGAGGGEGGGGGGGGAEKYIVHTLKSGGRGGGSGTYTVVVDTENHVIAVFSVSKNGSIVPVAVRNYTYDLLMEEYPHEKLPKEWDKGFSSWDIRAWWEDLKTKEIMKKEGKKKDEIKDEDLAPPIGSGTGKTQVKSMNTIAQETNPIENLVIIDNGSHKEDSAGVTMLAYEMNSNGLVPRSIRTLTQDFNLAKYKLKKGSANSYNGDFKNVEGRSDGFHVRDIEEFIKKQQEQQEKKQEKENK